MHCPAYRSVLYTAFLLSVVHFKSSHSGLRHLLQGVQGVVLLPHLLLQWIVLLTHFLQHRNPAHAS